MKSIILTLIIIFTTGIVKLHANPFSNSVVKITITKQKYDHNSPWQMKAVQKNELTGCLISGNRILTEAYQLANHVHIEVSKQGSERKYPARVIIKDYNRGLAIIKVTDKAFYQGMQPLSLCSNPEMIKKKALVVNWGGQGELRNYNASFIKSRIRFYNTYSAVLVYHMRAELEKGGDGEPLIVEGKVAGISSWFDSKNKMINIISVDVIRQMLTDLKDGTYNGVPYFYIDEVPLRSDENLREKMGLTAKESGILIVNVPTKTSGSDKLKKGDVILSINGKNIDDKGLFQAPHYGKLNFYGLIYLYHHSKGSITMGIIREKKRLTVSFKLKSFSSKNLLVPNQRFDVPPSYYISGGLVFQELTENFLKTWGNNWVSKANKRMMYYYENFSSHPTNGLTRMVIMNRILPASVNTGYHGVSNMILKKINGKPVRDLPHLKKIIERSKNKFLIFDFIGNYSIVLDRQKVVSSVKEILKRYNIQKPYYLEN